MTGWTPGPWWHSDLIESRDFEVFATEDPDRPGPYQICRLPDYRKILPADSRLFGAPQRANAHLVAAAPELAAALSACLSAIAAQKAALEALEAPLDAALAATIAPAEAALAKAKGAAR